MIGQLTGIGTQNNSTPSSNKLYSVRITANVTLYINSTWYQGICRLILYPSTKIESYNDLLDYIVNHNFVGVSGFIFGSGIQNQVLSAESLTYNLNNEVLCSFVMIDLASGSVTIPTHYAVLSRISMTINNVEV